MVANLSFISHSEVTGSKNQDIIPAKLYLQLTEKLL